MKRDNRKTYGFLIAAILIVGGFGAWYVTSGDNGIDPEDENPTGPRTLIDSFGNEFTVPSTIERSVVQSGPSLTYTSFLGPEVMGTIVATSADVSHEGGKNTYSAAYDLSGVATIPLASFLTDSIETIITLDPDIVIISSSNQLTDSVINFINTLKGAGIPVCAVSSVTGATEESFQYNLRLVANIYGIPDRAEYVIQKAQEYVRDLEALLDTVTEAETKTAFAGGINWGGALGFTKSTTEYTPFQYFGDKVRNIMFEIKEWDGNPWTQQVSWEMLYDYDETHGIDMIFIDSGSGYSLVVTEYAEFPDRFTTLNAWQTAEVYAVLPWVSRGLLPDSSIIIAYQIALMLYPESFDASFDIEDFGKEVWETFVGYEGAGDVVYAMQREYLAGLGVEGLYSKSPLLSS
ncbi:MAG: ABC transporter substrate-binding protein [Candidatus Methanofastidiosa archaeon]|nr:ABC transporter substrate-binding protein [Candidatus Methanofastidiosa archaeon]